MWSEARDVDVKYQVMLLIALGAVRLDGGDGGAVGVISTYRSKCSIVFTNRGASC